MFKIKALGLAIATLVMLPGVSTAAIYNTAAVPDLSVFNDPLYAFTGSRTIAGGGLVKVGGGSQFTAATVSWSITNPNLTDGLLHYSYTVTTNSQQGVSHLILDLSDDAGCTLIGNCFKNFAMGSGGSTGSIEFNTYSAGGSNPGMAGSIKGVKVNISSGGSSFSFSFDSNRVPVWHDIYAKGGNGTSNGFAFDNKGISLHASSLNPNDFIATPNSSVFTCDLPPTDPNYNFEECPEPATMAMFAAALFGMGAVHRRRRKVS